MSPRALLPLAFLVLACQDGIPAVNRPPDPPTVPAGPVKTAPGVYAGYASLAFDPDTDDVAIRFALSVIDTTEWSSFGPSGSAASNGVAWPPGHWTVTAQALDAHGALSDWSLPCSVLTTDWPGYPDSFVALVDQTGEDGEMVASPDGQYVYQFDWRVVRIRTDNHTVDITSDRGYGYTGAISPDGGHLYVAGRDGLFRLRVDDFTATDSFRPPGRYNEARDVIASADGRHVFLGTDGPLYVLRAEDLAFVCSIPRIRWCVALALAGDGIRLYAASGYDTLYGLDARNWSVFGAGYFPARDEMTLDCLPGGNEVWLTDYDGKVRVFDAYCRSLATLNLWASDVAPVPGTGLIFLPTGDCIVQVADVAARTVIGRVWSHGGHSRMSRS